MKKIIALAVLAGMLGGCNVASRHFGGTMKVEIKKGEKLVNATWKESSLWVLTQDETGQMHFREYSTFGLLQGSVEFK